MNSLLVLEAVKACSKFPLPYIIAANFNVNPFSSTLTHVGLKDLIFLSRQFEEDHVPHV